MRSYYNVFLLKHIFWIISHIPEIAVSWGDFCCFITRSVYFLISNFLMQMIRQGRALLKGNWYTYRYNNVLKTVLQFFETESTLKGKNLLTTGSKFFSFWEDSFSERTWWFKHAHLLLLWWMVTTYVTGEHLFSYQNSPVSPAFVMENKFFSRRFPLRCIHRLAPVSSD